MNNDLAFELTDIIKTKCDAARLITACTRGVEAKFHTQKDLGNSIQELLPYDTKEKLLTLIQKHTKDSKETDAFLQEVITTVNNMPTVTLTLACEASQDLINAISTWFVVSAKRPVILNIVVKGNIIAGAIIAYRGLYKDFSMHKTLTEKIQKKEIQFTDFL